MYIMNPLQSGTRSSQLVPQSYKNSNQSPGLQESSNTQTSDEQELTINTLQSDLVLRVESSPKLVIKSENVAGASVAVPSADSSGLVFPIFVVVVAALLFLHFTTKILAIQKVDNSK